MSAEQTGSGGVGTALEIAAGQYSARIATTGAGLCECRRGDTHLTEPWDPVPGQKSPLSAGLILAPWPNRTADGRYSFDGTDFQLDVTETTRNNANHGFVRTVDWDVLDRDDSAVALVVEVGQHPGWPFELTLTVEYRLDPHQGLTVTHTAANTGTSAAPYALGHHAFLRVGDVSADDCRLQLAATQTLPLDPDRQLPEGDPHDVTGTGLDFSAPRPLAGVWLDNPFTGMIATDGRYVHRLSAPSGGSTELWTDLNFGWVQAFTADPERGQGFPGRSSTARGSEGRRAVAVEPMTAPPNALASGVDLIRLEAGQTWSASWGLRGR